MGINDDLVSRITDKRLFFVNSKEVSSEHKQIGFLVIDQNNNGIVDDSDSVIIEDSFLCKKDPSPLPKYTTISLGQFRTDFFNGKLTLGITHEIGTIDPLQLNQEQLFMTTLQAVGTTRTNRRKIYDVLHPVPITPLVNTGNCPIDEKAEWKGPFSHRKLSIERITVCPLTNSKDGRTHTYSFIRNDLMERVLKLALSDKTEEQNIAKRVIGAMEGGVVIFLYTTEAYQVINPMLRGKKPGLYGITFRDPRLRALSPDKLRETLAPVIDEMDKTLDTLPPYVGTVYRVQNFSPDDARRFFDKYRIGKIVEEKSYFSTATDPEIVVYGSPDQSFEARFEIASTFGRNIKYFSMYPKEDEILFKHGTRFVIEDVRIDARSNTGTPKTFIRVKMREVLVSE